MLLSGAAGERVDGSVLVKNQTLVDASVTVRVVDLEEGRGNTLEFLDVGTARRGAGEWVDLRDRRLRVPAGTERAARFTVAIPRGAGAGGHYAGLIFTVRPAESTGQLEVDYEPAVPVFVTVDGDVGRDLRVEVQAADRWRWTGGDAEWTVELHNAGDVHENVSGRLHLDTLLSGSSSARLQPGILLPGERREQRIRFGLRSAPDLVRADARVELDDAPAATGTSDRTVVLPWWLLLLLAAVIVVIWWRMRERRRRAHAVAWTDDDVDGIAPAG